MVEAIRLSKETRVTVAKMDALLRLKSLEAGSQRQGGRLWAIKMREICI